MKLAVISDIHGNFEALRQVLADLDACGVEQVVCLGDCVGYGPEPEAVVRAIRSRSIACVYGNHEMAVNDPVHLEWFNHLARRSLELTIGMLEPESLEFLKNLPSSMIVFGCRCVHGFPPDSAKTYLFEKGIPDLTATLKVSAERVCFVGHTHDLEIVRYDGSDIERRALHRGITRLDAASRYIINVGSVGQPRDGDNRAKYVIFDQDAGHIEVRCISYDIAATAAKIIAAGLPKRHADRLW